MITLYYRINGYVFGKIDEQEMLTKVGALEYLYRLYDKVTIQDMFIKENGKRTYVFIARERVLVGQNKSLKERLLDVFRKFKIYRFN